MFLVWNASEPAPVRRVATPDAEHGRGLTLVLPRDRRHGTGALDALTGAF